MNYRRRVLQFNLIFLGSLILVSVLYPKIDALQSAGLRSPDILSEVKYGSSEKRGRTKLQTTETGKPGEKIILKDYTSADGLINSSGNASALSSFIGKLAALKKDKSKKVRIAWFGDSFIEGDLITQDLRKKFQQDFGGSGVGFVGVTSITAGFRQTIVHGFSDGWNDINFKSDEKKSENLFLSGHCFYSNGTNTISYRAVKQPLLDSFTRMDVLYGKSKNGDGLQLTVNGASHSFPSAGLFNADEINVNGKSVNIAVPASDVPIYGFSFEGNGGVVLDNFSFRGISGVELANFNDGFLKEIDKKHPYDLVVLQYGPNLLFKGELTDFSWYQKKMEPILKKLKADFPETDFLLVSTADKGYRYGGEWQTQKGVEPLIDAQYDMASASQMDFFNLYHAMGGNGKMIEWVNAKPALANKDYTHVNGRGATAIADLIYTAIINEYNAHSKNHH